MTNNQIPTSPGFKHLAGQADHIGFLRTSVAPILSNRLLTHFTDHSVTHSDRVTKVVDELIEPLQASKHVLTEQELTVLYAACYLHDIGMHYENAGETKIIQSLNLKRAWPELPESQRRDLLRKYHHLISAEMVMASVRAENPVIGLQMTDQYKPALIASLCEAQNLPIDSDRYQELTADVAGLRMRLLSGLLRLADILEESRRRATLEQARTLQLDLTSQTHWWRHYYTTDVTIDQNHRLVTIWFDFPSDRHSEFSSVVPQLQMPWIENEFNYHAPIFHQYGLGWSVTYTVRPTPYSDAATMPDAVLSEMLKQVLRQRRREDKERRYESLKHFRRSMPFFDRRISELEAKKETLSVEEYLNEFAEISRDLWDLGAERGASELLSSAYNADVVRLTSPVQRIKIGVQLAKMFNEQEEPRRAVAILQDLKQASDELPEGDEGQFIFWQLYAQTLVALCSYEEAVKAYEHAFEIAPHDESRNELESQVAELRLLYGDIESLVSITK